MDPDFLPPGEMPNGPAYTYLHCFDNSQERGDNERLSTSCLFGAAADINR